MVACVVACAGAWTAKSVFEITDPLCAFGAIPPDSLCRVGSAHRICRSCGDGWHTLKLQCRVSQVWPADDAWRAWGAGVLRHGEERVDLVYDLCDQVGSRHPLHPPKVALRGPRPFVRGDSTRSSAVWCESWRGG